VQAFIHFLLTFDRFSFKSNFFSAYELWFGRPQLEMTWKAVGSFRPHFWRAMILWGGFTPRFSKVGAIRTSRRDGDLINPQEKLMACPGSHLTPPNFR
jgi:hypothetical protein